MAIFPLFLQGSQSVRSQVASHTWWLTFLCRSCCIETKSLSDFTPVRKLHSVHVDESNTTYTYKRPNTSGSRRTKPLSVPLIFYLQPMWQLSSHSGLKQSSSSCLLHPSQPALHLPADMAVNIRSNLYVDVSSWTLTARQWLLMSPWAIMKVKSLLNNGGAAKWWKYSSTVIGYRVSKNHLLYSGWTH